MLGAEQWMQCIERQEQYLNGCLAIGVLKSLFILILQMDCLCWTPHNKRRAGRKRWAGNSDGQRKPEAKRQLIRRTA